MLQIYFIYISCLDAFYLFFSNKTSVIQTVQFYNLYTFPHIGPRIGYRLIHKLKCFTKYFGPGPGTAYYARYSPIHSCSVCGFIPSPLLASLILWNEGSKVSAGRDCSQIPAVFTCRRAYAHVDRSSRMLFYLFIYFAVKLVSTFGMFLATASFKK